MSVPRLPPKNPEDYQVGWICALPKERTAAVAMLDIRHNSLPRFPDDTNIYELGSMGSHNVVIACLPKGKYGTVPAATVANNLMRTFPAIKFGLMVGIGGGIPPKVRLGDVVISVPAGPLPGVVQWDMGKAELGGVFKRTGVLSNPPPLLLGAVSIMESEQELNGSKVPDFLDDLAQKFPRLASGYLKPDAVKDVLFKASYAHVRRQAFDEAEDEYEEEDDNCDLCDKQQAVKRKPRDMKVHYGTIASGNQVIKYAHRRNALVQELGGDILCVEMEAAGLMDNFPCIVIRGICDYADDHKNKAWQKHAAAVAAASAKELLGHVVPDDIDALQSARDMLAKISETVETIYQETAETKTFLSKRNAKEFLDWLSIERYATQQSDTLKEWQAGTCGWFLDSPKYQNWLQGTKTTLFCPGIPGAGKTVMSCAVIHTIGENITVGSKVGLAYVYFAFSRQHEQTVEHVLASLLAQLLRGVETPPSKLSEIKHNGRRPTRTELVDQLCVAASYYEKVFIVLDALDECSSKEQCRATVLSDVSLIQSRTAIRILATSRYDDEIASILHGPHASTLPISAREEDVERFLSSELRNFDPDIFDAGFVAEVASKVVKVTDGMFLLAKLHLNTLLASPTKGSAKRILSTLSSGPDALEKVYDLAMERIQQQGDLFSDLAHRTLMWIVHARRPLLTAEIQHALAIDPGSSALDRDFLPSKTKLKSICAGLVTLDEDSNIVRLVHYTTQEYFVKTRKFDTANIQITKACVTYLTFKCFETLPTTWVEHMEKEQTYPFYGYAASEWVYHGQACADQSEVIEFLKQNTRFRTSCIRQNHLGYTLDVWADTQGTVTALDSVLPYRRNMADRPIITAISTDAMDASQITPLLYAMRAGSLSLVRILLDGGDIYVNRRCKFQTSHSPLSWAASRKDLKMIRLLLEAGKVDMDCTPRFTERSLMYESDFENVQIVNVIMAWMGAESNRRISTSRNDYLTMLQSLMKVGILNSNGRDIAGFTYIWWSARRGDIEMTNLLLDDGGADPTISHYLFGEPYGTPLDMACRNHHIEIIRKLLATGRLNIDTVNMRDGLSPLAFAISTKWYSAVQLLLKAGAVYKEPRDGTVFCHGATELGYAAENGWMHVVNILFKTNRVYLTAKDKRSGCTVLSWAAKAGYTEVVRLLLKRKQVDIHARDEDSVHQHSPLEWAAKGGHTDVAKLLLDAAKEVAEPQGQCSAFRLAAQNGHVEVLELLLKMNRGDMGGGKQYATPSFYSAIENGHVEVAKLLLGIEAVDIDGRDEFGDAPEYLASLGGYIEVVRLLMEKKKADNNSADWQAYMECAMTVDAIVHDACRRPWYTMDELRMYRHEKRLHGKILHLAVKSGSTSVVKMFLKSRRVDMNSTYMNGKTPLYVAAEEGRVEVLRLLLGSSLVDTDARAKDGKIPLHAAAKGHAEAVEVLLSSSYAAINTKDNDGNTPLHVAAYSGDANVVKTLLETGQADLTTKETDNGWTPLFVALKHDHVDVVQLLFLHAGLEDLDAKDNRGRTLLHLAAKHASASAVSLLLSRLEPKHMMAKDAKGQTPLCLAAKAGRPANVRLLMGMGQVDLKAKHVYNDRTAIHLAIRGATTDYEVLELLLSKADEEDVNAKDRSDRTPISLAMELGYINTVRLLLNTKKVNSGSRYSGYTSVPSTFEDTADYKISHLLQNTGSGFDWFGEELKDNPNGMDADLIDQVGEEQTFPLLDRGVLLPEHHATLYGVMIE